MHLIILEKEAAKFTCRDKEHTLDKAFLMSEGQLITSPLATRTGTDGVCSLKWMEDTTKGKNSPDVLREESSFAVKQRNQTIIFLDASRLGWSLTKLWKALVVPEELNGTQGRKR